MATKSRRHVAAIVLCALMSLGVPAQATTFSSDYSDLWWNPTESGWGIQFVQQANTIFATMFVYDAANSPVWYTATLTPAGANVFRGDLHVTRGPWFGGTFSSSAVGYRVVGTMTASFAALERGTLSYSVDGVDVLKAIERQTFKIENFNGVFGMMLRASASGCAGVPPGEPVLAGVAAELVQDSRTLTAQMVIIYEQTMATCTYSGNYTQSGHYGRSEGTYSCSGGIGTAGDSGTYVLSAMQVQQGTLTANYVQRGRGGCTLTGVVAGVSAE
jgi:hypothetical protein